MCQLLILANLETEMSPLNDAVPAKNQEKRVDLDSPRWDQSSFMGRFKHFASITNMLLGLKSEKELNDAQQLLTLYRSASKLILTFI